MVALMLSGSRGTGVLVLLGLLVLVPVAGREKAPANNSISADDLQRDVFFLASDEMRGRLVGTPGNRLAARFIEARFAQLGLWPVGSNRSYLHTFELVTPTLGTGGNALLVHADGASEAGELGQDFYPERFSGTGHARGALVFAGFGISAPDLGHDDYRSADLDGRVVLVLNHEPAEFDAESPFDGVFASEHGRALRKALEAQRRGASAILFVADVHNHSAGQSLTSMMQNAWPTESRRVPAYQLAAWVSDLHIPAARISSDQAKRLVQASGETLNALAQHAETTGGVIPIGIPNVAVELDVTVRRSPMSVHNVVGLVEGADPALRDEWIILCAHYDHEGATQTQIFSGADDDASGVAGLLEIAEAYALAARQGRRPRRSVLFAAWNAEERGLLGAWAYVEQPLAPLADTVAVINMDMIGRHEEIPSGGNRRFIGLDAQTADSNRNTVNILGYSYSADLRTAVEVANETADLVLRFRYDRNRSNLLRRSDHWPFLFNKVPALFVHTGLHPDYHTARDRPEKLDYEKMTRVVQLVHQLSWNLAHADNRPALD